MPKTVLGLGIIIAVLSASLLFARISCYSIEFIELTTLVCFGGSRVV